MVGRDCAAVAGGVVTLVELVPAVRPFDVIVVTGPQRSGTTIATKMLAELLPRNPVLEEAFNDDDLGMFGSIVNGYHPCVVQAPALSCAVHLLKGTATCVVFMRRSLVDIVTSQQRIGWTYEEAEKKKYGRKNDPHDVAVIKEDAWRWQKQLLAPRAFDLEYESLASHPLWVPKEQRAAFKPRQTM